LDSAAEQVFSRQLIVRDGGLDAFNDAADLLLLQCLGFALQLRNFPLHLTV
jgi:hypothetical protein